ncbi:hypothetical protein DDQ41_18855 [Streptomyces spongiicola]|uniref:Uncharacterized protein n=1 Tax=Streptomyces spongiicola TaxID=1690221 RepID=A0ABN5KR45_9ACTN|nr:hypothetical protein [Streptomyces spongiicola]AWK10614.1 hypothetical protein DDQ41_18855 [Streptomyces spongiicola]
MSWVVGTGTLPGLLAIAWAIVTLRTGWVAPMARRYVAWPHLRGLADLLTGSPAVLRSLFCSRLPPSVSWDVR